jgi:glycosyltransferase involved in cell wall biosynthesis
MRIGVDGRALAGESGLRQQRGIARYASSLLTALVARHPGDDWRVVLPRGATEPPIAGVTFVHHRFPHRAVHAAAALARRPRLDRVMGGDLDVVWLPAPAPVAVSADTPYVLTVHDLSSELRRSDLGAYARLWSLATRARALAERAASVVTDSTDTHDQVVSRWGVPAERVAVVRPGAWHPPVVPATERDAILRRLSAPDRYLLYVGALEPRKGLEVLLEAFGRARRRGLAAELVLAGEGVLGERLGAPGVLLTGRVTDAELGSLYTGARATVLPSLLEGFGFTPLESLAAGTPAVASDLPAVRENLGDGALLVAPGDVQALADALLRVDRDEELRQRLLERGREALAKLSWERAAGEAHEVLARAAGGPAQ